MPRSFVILASLAAALIQHGALAENIIQVHVGMEGSFYNPSAVFAQVNDIVHFIFDGPFHDVTQSSFDRPCQPLDGGFSSGLAGRGADGNGPIPTWDLRITNVSSPIWYYCGAQRPLPHCTAGMVGAINPQSPDMFNRFAATAKNLSMPSPMPAPSVVLTGRGAFATAPPTVSGTPTASASLTSTPESSSSSITGPTDTPLPAAVTPSHKTPQGTIIGAAVGGSVGFLAICFLVFLLYRARGDNTPNVSPYVNTSDPHGPTSPPSNGEDINRSMSQLKIHRSTSDPILSGSGMSQVSSIPATPATSPLPLAYSPPSTAQSALSPASPEPARRIRPLPPSPQAFGNILSQEQASPIPNRAVEREPPSSPPMNINELAREVAAILHPSPGLTHSNTTGSFLQLSEEGGTSENRVKWQQPTHVDRDRGASPPPPHYQG